eukprot:scpid45826/ scgid2625/ Alpha-L-fucosidase; Alpha-L-fucoside fucohydrolase
MSMLNGWCRPACWLVIVLAWCNVSPALSACTFGVDNPAAAGCVHYDLSALQNPKGYPAADEDHANVSYVLNVCGNLDASSLPSGCAALPASPAYQLYFGDCYYLAQLNSSLVYPVDPSNATAGVRIVYYNGANHSYQHQDREIMDYGSIGIGDAEQGKPLPKDVHDIIANRRAVILDFICDPSAGMGSPQEVHAWPPYVYRVTWRSAHACPVSTSTTACPAPPFEPNWLSVSFRPRPTWFDDVKFGIFIHWGIFSVPSFKTEWYWRRLMTGDPDTVNFHNRVYGCSGVQPEKFPCTGEEFSYADFAPMFNTDFYDPDEWAALFKNSGAKYIVLTSKHHEGWCNFPSAQHWNWNSMDTGPHRDLVGELTDSVRAAGLHMGLYHSMREWYNPLFLEDNDNNCTDPKFVDEVLMPTLKDMTTRYKPEVIWADGAAGDNPCSRDSVTYWKAPEFISWLYNESPVKDTVLVNSRWGTGSGGDYTTGPDRWTPGKKVSSKWESCFTIQQHSWGFDRTEGIANFINTTDLIYQLVDTVSCNGNLLLNIGPTADGRIVPAFEERLLQIGDWMKVNGDAIYGTKPWIAQNDTSAKRIWYTQSKATGDVYAISFDWPVHVSGGKPGDVVLTQIKNAPSTVSVQMMGMSGKLTASQAADGFHITVPDVDTIRLPCQHAWVFVITGLPQ